MKKLCLIFFTFMLVSCASLPNSPENLKQHPSQVINLHSVRNYQDAYRRLNERMKSCMATKFGASEFRVEGNLYADLKLGVSELFVPGWTHSIWLVLVETTPDDSGGSNVKIYFSTKIKHQFDYWLNTDDLKCNPEKTK